MSDRKPFAGETALVTGASSGIGKAVAETLADIGANIVLVARREKELEAIVEDLNSSSVGSAIAVPTDIRDNKATNEAVQIAINQFEALDIVVINAGIGVEGGFEDLSLQEYQDIIGVNIDGAYHTTKSAVTHLKETNGRIVFIGSYAAKYPYPNNPIYAATKWWMRGFALSLAGRLGKDGVSVSIIHPSEVRTEFGSEYTNSYKERFEPGTVAEPDDVAECVVFAAKQTPPNSVTEMDYFRRDKYSHFGKSGSM